MTGPQSVLSALASELAGALRADLLGLYVHGSWVTGDFAPSRSDLDLLAVLAREPDELLLMDLGNIHARVEMVHPEWRGRVEVEYVALDAVAAFASSMADAGEHAIARISPGEALHLLPATSHRVLTWSAVRDSGRSMVGPPAHALLPAIDPGTVRAAAREHVRDWPTWVTQMRGPGGQAYAVLTLCRALHLFSEDSQVSKRQAASYAVAAIPHWSELVTWARNWWYAGGSADEASRLDEVTAFVQEVSARILDPRPGA